MRITWRHEVQLEIHFMDPAESPVPPDEVSFRKFAATPLPDGRRVRVAIELTPFQERPDIAIQVLDPQQELTASTAIIEAIEHRMELTLHLPGSAPPGEYRVQAELTFPERNLRKLAEASFSVRDESNPDT